MVIHPGTTRQILSGHFRVLDKFDLAILAAAQEDARIPMPDLAARVGLSAPACYRRLRALRDQGAIERDIAVVAPRTMG